MSKSEKFKNFCDTLSLNFLDLYEHFNDNMESYEELQEAVENAEHDIIYYSEAIRFLKDNDPSLKESLELADTLSYSVKQLNSEILASLLFRDKVLNELHTNEDEIREFFDNYEDEYETKNENDDEL
jgi:hypothetical protein